MKKVMTIILSIVVLVSFTTVIVLNQAKFGKAPSGTRLDRIKASPDYKNGSFQNRSYTPVMPDDVSMFRVMKEGMFNRSKRNVPKNTLPSRKSDLKALDPKADVLVWFGHSSILCRSEASESWSILFLAAMLHPFRLW